MKDDHVTRALELFGVTLRSVAKPPDAKLAEVYIVNDRYVLRARPHLEDTLPHYEAEQRLLEATARLTGYAFPKYLPCRDGEHHVLIGQRLWTLHEWIPGQPLGKWFELHTIPSRVDRQVMCTLSRLHKATKGRFDPSEISRTYFPDMIRLVLSEAHGFLAKESLQRIRAAFQRVESFSNRYPTREACFVHGDFHHGNVLADEDTIVGFIDLDWCRVGHGLEDLGFTLMMLLRDYRTWSPVFRRKRYEDILSLYGFEGDVSILNDYTALYALFDCDVFRSATFDNAPDFYEYQKSFLETLCATLVSPGI